MLILSTVNIDLTKVRFLALKGALRVKVPFNSEDSVFSSVLSTSRADLEGSSPSWGGGDNDYSFVVIVHCHVNVLLTVLNCDHSTRFYPPRFCLHLTSSPCPAHSTLCGSLIPITFKIPSLPLPNHVNSLC